MDWEVILKGVGLILFGLLFVRLGLDGWQHRREERISMIEAAMLKSGRENKPLPSNRWDRAMAYVQPVLMLVFGPGMIFLGSVLLLV